MSDQTSASRELHTNELLAEMIERFPDLYELGYQYKSDSNASFWTDCHVSVFQTCTTGQSHERRPARRILKIKGVKSGHLDTSKDRWSNAIGFLMNAFNAPEFEDADDEVNMSWRSIAYHMIEYADKIQPDELSKAQERIENLLRVINSLNENIRDAEKVLWFARDKNPRFDKAMTRYTDKYHQ